MQNTCANKLIIFFSVFLSLFVLFNKNVSAENNDVEEKHYQDWRMTCDNTNKEKQPCHISQNIFIKESGLLLLSVSVAIHKNGSDLTMAFTLPLGIYIPAGMAFNIDGGQQIQLAITTCLPNGCKTETRLNVPLLNELRKGKNIKVAFLNSSTREQIIVDVSLKGFDNGITGL